MNNEEIKINDRESFSLRLAQLREMKKISARDMSLRMGHNKNYINQIELKKANPTMDSFFTICDYLDISPKDFFNPEIKNVQKHHSIDAMLQKLSPQQYELVYKLIQELIQTTS